jgi:hypothetical protein
MKNSAFTILLCSAFWLSNQLSQGHEEPTSFLELHFEGDGIRSSLVASVADLAHELEDTEPQMLLNQAVLRKNEKKLTEIILSRLRVAADGKTLATRSISASPLPEQNDIRFDFNFAPPSQPREMTVECKLFPQRFTAPDVSECLSGKVIVTAGGLRRCRHQRRICHSGPARNLECDR